MKYLICLALILLSLQATAQNIVYTAKLRAGFNKNIAKEKVDSITRGPSPNFKDVFIFYKTKLDKLPKVFKDSALKIHDSRTLSSEEKRELFKTKRNAMLDSTDELVAQAYEVLYTRNQWNRMVKDREKKDYKKKELIVWHKRPGRYWQSFQTQRFFEDDSLHKRFFQNSNINYSPSNRQLSLYTEVVNDYFGPIRVGAGFQIAPKTSQAKADSTEKKDIAKNDLVSQLQNSGGGVFSVNLSYPLMENKTRWAK